MPSIITQHEARALRSLTPMVLGALQGVSPEQLVFTVPGFRSHMLWSAGHIAWSIDVALGAAIGCKPGLAPVYSEKFSFGSNPSSKLADFPAIDVLCADLAECTDRVATFLGASDDALLGQPLPGWHPLAKVFPNLGALVGMTSFHTGYHLGQIGLLRRVQGLSAALGA